MKIQGSYISLFAWSCIFFARLYEIFICIIKSLTSLKPEIQSGEGVDTVISELAGDKKNCNPLVKKENENDAGLPCCS
jgi:hypothetical protein